MRISGKQEHTKFNKTELSLRLVLIASPWILLFVTTFLIGGHAVFRSVPCWSDELAYWHEVFSFSQKGFNFGYYSMNEVIPKYLSFGSHGFGTVSVYALFAKVFGWKAYSLVIANAFFISLAFLGLTVINRISTKNLFFILLFFLTYTPLILFTSTSMTELLNYALLMVYVGSLVKYNQQANRSWLVFLLVYCTAISFVRVIYILLFLPLLFNRKNEFRVDGKLLIHFVVWIAFSGFLFVFNNLFVSPYPGSFLNDLFKSNGFTDFVSNFAIHFVQNTLNLMNPLSENIIQVWQRYFLIVLLLVCLLKSNVLQSSSKKLDKDYFIVFLMLFLFLMVNLLAYDVFDWRDYRVLAPILFGCVLYLIMRDKISYGYIAFNLIGIVFLVLSPQVVESFNQGRYNKTVKNDLFSHVEYTVQPKSRFENTIIVQQFNTETVLNIPAGIGISYSDVLSDSLRSRYIYSLKKLNISSYQLIGSNKSGYLYRKTLTANNE